MSAVAASGLAARARRRLALFLAVSATALATGCHALVDFDYDVDVASSSGGATTVATTAASNASTTGGPSTAQASTVTSTVDASSASTGLVGNCITPEFHQTFDADPAVLSPLFVQASPGARTDELTRAGAGAWAIDLAEGQGYSRLVWTGLDDGDEIWVGFSWAHLSATVHDGQLFEVTCSQGMDHDYHETQAFGLQLAGNAPNFPFRVGGLASSASQSVPDALGAVQQTVGTYQDWIVHFRVSEIEEGFVEVWHKDDAGVWGKVLRAEGLFGDPLCETSVLRWELVRWPAGPPAEHVVFDEIRVIRVKDDVPTENDYLYSLDPDSGCAAAAL